MTLGDYLLGLQREMAEQMLRAHDLKILGTLQGQTRMKLLTQLIAFADVPKSLRQIIHLVLGDNWGGVDAERILRKVVNDQVGRTAGKELGKRITKAIDGVVAAEIPNTTTAQRGAIANQFARNVALQLAEAANLVLEYPQYQQAVEEAKRRGQTSEVDKAKSARQRAQDELHQALVDVGRVLAGDDPSDAGREEVEAAGASGQ